MSPKNKNKKIIKDDNIIEGDNNDDFDINDGNSLFENGPLMNKIQREHTKRVERWRKKKKRKTEDSSTVEGVLDLTTSKEVSKLISQGYIKGLGGVVSTGKEANVYHAYANLLKLTEKLPELAVKIYRTRTLDFKKIRTYIDGDIRFQKKSGRKSHQIIQIWALKEFKNLSRAYENKIIVPRPLVVRRNVLMMEFIGDNGIAAPILQKVDFIKSPKKLYTELIDQIDKLWNKANLVHGDLSPYNILYSNEKPVIIDIGQGVVRDHHLAEPLMYRDLINMVDYFASIDIECPFPDELYEEITGNKPDPSFETIGFM
ncbi:MAG: serine protein kinase RIO [Candidatus Hodarchaeales archaeon]|jgi:RIO kinase 1